MRIVFAFVALVCLFTIQLPAQQSDVPQDPIVQTIVYYAFPQPPPPSCVSYSFTLAAPKDVKPGGNDCCIPDDVIEVYLDGCPVGTINSNIVGNAFTRVGPVTALAGTHDVTYCNTSSGTGGASGWYLDNLTPPPGDGLLDPTGTNACRSVQLAVIAAVDDEAVYKNHGEYVSAATAALQATGVIVSPECQSCIINQFARSVPQADMKACCGL